ncbi:hypothetical protein OXPF_35380 [Oxobacter pfennigii]|uniref:Uncharacterized protein n=1 Tax=Oxobacter pfennigii TaxID=36849 RepID=A0A0P9ACF3_9CLOT|nr:hypothetical protein OXPF_35380 [Oxobacter pfennigii]
MFTDGLMCTVCEQLDTIFRLLYNYIINEDIFYVFKEEFFLYDPEGR